MKKILFDLTVCQPLANIKFHGGGTYGYIVFRALCKKKPNSVVAYIDMTRFIDPVINEYLNLKDIKVVDASKVELRNAVSDEIAVFYSPLFKKDYLQLTSLGILIYITFHGMRKLELNRDQYEYLYAVDWKNFIKAKLKQTFLYNFVSHKFFIEYKDFLEYSNVRVITVSNHSKAAIQYFYPSLSSSNIQVFYSPSTSIDNYESIIPYRKDKYYIIVSANRWLKNSFRAIMAFDSLFEKFPNIQGQVIVVGLNNNQLFKKVRQKNRFEVFDYVDRKTLESMLKGAYLLVYPSLNEGFGYPPLEAMKYGTPVVSSSFSAISEVCGDSVMYVNPYSIDEIAMRILQMEDDEIHEKYVRRGRDRYSVIEARQKSDLDKLVSKLIDSLR